MPTLLQLAGARRPGVLDGVNLVEYPNNRVYYIAFNNLTSGVGEPTEDVRVRQAFNLAVDTEGIIGALFAGLVFSHNRTATRAHAARIVETYTREVSDIERDCRHRLRPREVAAQVSEALECPWQLQWSPGRRLVPRIRDLLRSSQALHPRNRPAATGSRVLGRRYLVDHLLEPGRWQDRWYPDRCVH